MDATAAKDRLRQWITDVGAKPGVALGDTNDIVGEGFLDSLGLMSLISYVEELRGRPIEEDELRMENFTCLARIVEVFFAAAPARTAPRR
jgi:acyl carrier protein